MMPNTANKTKHILISQIKNVGDVVLALPVAGLIREYFPDAKISFLGARYTQSIIEGCSYIQQAIDWDAMKEKSDIDIIQQLKEANITTIIHLCQNARIIKLAKKAGIPYRIGTLQRLSNLLNCNRWVNQGRRHARLHEVELNVHMLRPLGIRSTLTVAELGRYMHLKPRVSLPQHIEALLSPDRFNLILHPGSNGHGREWPSDAFQQLISMLPEKDYRIFLTGTPRENERFNDLIEQSPHAVNVMGMMTLNELIAFISRVDGLVASGTGPLHLSAALGIKTLGLFPPRQGISPRRWAPVGRQAAALMYDRPFYKTCLGCRDSVGCACMAKIQVSQVRNIIQRWRDEK